MLLINLAVIVLLLDPLHVDSTIKTRKEFVPKTFQPQTTRQHVSSSEKKARNSQGQKQEEKGAAFLVQLKGGCSGSIIAENWVFYTVFSTSKFS